MIWVLEYIKGTFPIEWLSNIGDNKFDDFGETGTFIKHPDNDNFRLDVVITEERVGIAILYKSEEDISVDIGGFNYNFEKYEADDLKSFLRYFLVTGKLPNQ